MHSVYPRQRLGRCPIQRHTMQTHQESTNWKMDIKIPYAHMIQKAKELAKEAVIRNNILWIRKIANWCYMFLTCTDMSY